MLGRGVQRFGGRRHEFTQQPQPVYQSPPCLAALVREYRQVPAVRGTV